MPETSKNIAIGLILTLALGLMLWVLLFLHPSFGDGQFRLHVRFSDIEKVNVGTRITYAGRPVGEVVKITQVPEEERHSANDPDDIFIYDLTLAIDSRIPLYDSDEITIGTSGLMGERFISIVPKRPKNHVAHPITYNEVVYSTNAPGMDDAFETVCRVAEQAEETMATLASLVKENRADVDATLKALKGATCELHTLLAKANEQDLVGKLTKTIQDTQAIVARVSAGEGSLGRLLVSDDFYCKTAGIMNKMDLLMNDVNHYGVLYHLDKGWQRDRRRRVEEIASLQSPEQFRTFLNDEMFKITSGLSRLGMALDKAQKDASSETPLVANREFGRTFNDVLAQIQDLQSTLKTYSIEIADRQTKEAEIAEQNK